MRCAQNGTEKRWNAWNTCALRALFRPTFFMAAFLCFFLYTRALRLILSASVSTAVIRWLAICWVRSVQNSVFLFKFYPSDAIAVVVFSDFLPQLKPSATGSFLSIQLLKSCLATSVSIAPSCHQSKQLLASCQRKVLHYLRITWPEESVVTFLLCLMHTRCCIDACR